MLPGFLTTMVLDFRQPSTLNDSYALACRIYWQKTVKQGTKTPQYDRIRYDMIVLFRILMERLRTPAFFSPINMPSSRSTVKSQAVPGVTKFYFGKGIKC